LKALEDRASMESARWDRMCRQARRAHQEALASQVCDGG
jgi:hypothetical protein